jgi:hypothetical protein
MKFLLSVLMMFSLILAGGNLGVRLFLDEAIAATPDRETRETGEIGETREEETQVKPCSREHWWERFFELENRENCVTEKNNDFDDEDLLPSRGAVAVSETIPYIITPRRTLLLNGRPIIRWNPVKDATSYTVIVKGPSGYLWQNEVTENEVVYPGEPVLKPGIYYTIIVDANTGASSLDDENFVQGFEVINESDRQRIDNAAEEIQASTAEEKSFKLAKLYGENSLRSEAIALLEKLAASGSDNEEIYHKLEQLYLEIGLVNLADKYAIKAVELGEIEHEK